MEERYLYYILTGLIILLIFVHYFSFTDYVRLKRLNKQLEIHETYAKISLRESGFLSRYWTRITTKGAERWF